MNYMYESKLNFILKFISICLRIIVNKCVLKKEDSSNWVEIILKFEIHFHTLKQNDCEFCGVLRTLLRG